MAALTPFEGVQAALRQMDGSTYRAVGWALMLQTARLQLRLGSSVVLDALVVDDGEVAAVRALGREFEVDSIVVLLRCDDEVLQRQRIEARSRPIPGWHELKWEFVERTRRRWTEPLDIDLALDSTRQIDGLVDEVIEGLR